MRTSVTEYESVSHMSHFYETSVYHWTVMDKHFQYILWLVSPSMFTTWFLCLQPTWNGESGLKFLGSKLLCNCIPTVARKKASTYHLIIKEVKLFCLTRWLRRRFDLRALVSLTVTHHCPGWLLLGPTV